MKAKEQKKTGKIKNVFLYGYFGNGADCHYIIPRMESNFIY